jgi:hypothetical protein
MELQGHLYLGHTRFQDDELPKRKESSQEPIVSYALEGSTF